MNRAVRQSSCYGRVHRRAIITSGDPHVVESISYFQHPQNLATEAVEERLPGDSGGGLFPL